MTVLLGEYRLDHDGSFTCCLDPSMVHSCCTKKFEAREAGSARYNAHLQQHIKAWKNGHKCSAEPCAGCSHCATKLFCPEEECTASWVYEAPIKGYEAQYKKKAIAGLEAHLERDHPAAPRTDLARQLVKRFGVLGVGCAGSCEDSSDDEDFLTAFEEHERLLPKPAMTRVQQEQAAFVLHTSATPAFANDVIRSWKANSETRPPMAAGDKPSQPTVHQWEAKQCGDSVLDFRVLGERVSPSLHRAVVLTCWCPVGSCQLTGALLSRCAAECSCESTPNLCGAGEAIFSLNQPNCRAHDKPDKPSLGERSALNNQVVWLQMPV